MSGNIPNILHFIWIDFDNELNNSQNSQYDIPRKYRQNIEHCAQVNNTFKVVVWNGVMCRNLIKNNYAWFLQVYDEFPFPIMRCDAIRYFILYHYGGIYIDADTMCNHSLTSMLHKSDVILTRQSNSTFFMLTNLFMASKQHSNFMLSCMHELKGTPLTHIRYIDVMNRTGPLFLSVCHHKYKKENRQDKDVITLISDEVNPCNICGTCRHPEISYTVHYFDKTWNDGFTRMLGSIYCSLHMLAVVFAVVAFILYVVCYMF